MSFVLVEVCKLQVNVSGSWRDVCTFEPSHVARVRDAVWGLVAALGARAKWCIVHSDGTREWFDALKST